MAFEACVVYWAQHFAAEQEAAAATRQRFEAEAATMAREVADRAVARCEADMTRAIHRAGELPRPVAQPVAAVSAAQCSEAAAGTAWRREENAPEGLTDSTVASRRQALAVL